MKSQTSCTVRMIVCSQSRDILLLLRHQNSKLHKKHKHNTRSGQQQRQSLPLLLLPRINPLQRCVINGHGRPATRPAGFSPCGPCHKCAHRTCSYCKLQGGADRHPDPLSHTDGTVRLRSGPPHEQSFSHAGQSRQKNALAAQFLSMKHVCALSEFAHISLFSHIGRSHPLGHLAKTADLRKKRPRDDRAAWPSRVALKLRREDRPEGELDAPSGSGSSTRTHLLRSRVRQMDSHRYLVSRQSLVPHRGLAAPGRPH